MIFAPCGIAASLFGFTTFIILEFLDGDVFKVLLQCRLLGVALVARMFLGTKQAKTSWLALVLVVLGAFAFTQAKQLSASAANFAGIVEAQAKILHESGHGT